MHVGNHIHIMQKEGEQAAQNGSDMVLHREFFFNAKFGTILVSSKRTTRRAHTLHYHVRITHTHTLIHAHMRTDVYTYTRNTHAYAHAHFPRLAPILHACARHVYAQRTHTTLTHDAQPHN